MKIAHVVCVFPPYKGGIGKSALDFSLMMSRENNEVTVFTPLYDLDEEGQKKIDKINIVKIKPFLRLGNGAFIPRLFFKLKGFDVIYLHYPFFGGSEIVWLFKIFNKKTKLVIHYHMDVLGLRGFLKILSLPSKIIKTSLFKRANLISVASLDYLENSEIKNIYSKNPEKFRETFFGVDTKKFFPLSAEKQNKQKTILFVGGLDRAHYFKGLNILFDTLDIIKNRKDWILKIVGRGELKKDYQNKTVNIGISDRVFFLDSVDDDQLPIVYRESDFLVLPSINKGEAFGIVLLEAMASGIPVIASNLAGVRSVFTDLEGLRVVPGDKNDLAKKILYFLDNEGLLKKAGYNSRLLVEKKYSYEKISERVNSIIKNL